MNRLYIFLILALSFLAARGQSTNVPAGVHATLAGTNFIESPFLMLPAPPKFTVTLYTVKGNVARVWKHCFAACLMTDFSGSDFTLIIDGEKIYTQNGTVSVEAEPIK